MAHSPFPVQLALTGLNQHLDESDPKPDTLTTARHVQEPLL